MPKTPETPIELMKLSDKLKADRCALMYLEKCTTVELLKYSPKKKRKVICSEYHAIKRTLLKYTECLVLLYSYLYSLPQEPKGLMSLPELFQNAAMYNQKLKLENDKEKTKDVREYVDYQEVLRKMMEVD